jgi:hypothetical protein
MLWHCSRQGKPKGAPWAAMLSQKMSRYWLSRQKISCRGPTVEMFEMSGVLD